MIKTHFVSQTTSVPKASFDIGTSGCAVWPPDVGRGVVFLPVEQRGRLFETKGLEVCRGSLGSAQRGKGQQRRGLLQFVVREVGASLCDN